MNQPLPGGPLGNQPKNAPDKPVISMLIMKVIGEMDWNTWSKLAPQGKAESIYYILAISMGWFGPPPGSQ